MCILWISTRTPLPPPRLAAAATAWCTKQVETEQQQQQQQRQGLQAAAAASWKRMSSVKTNDGFYAPPSVVRVRQLFLIFECRLDLFPLTLKVQPC